ncbi:hypothetical protein [Salinibacterium sp. ZJ454]|uniref:hypothetical protein n=1 Tax=Salinibacterium sp. ZJ454 TaxID=2708339 RepID=UPI001AB0477B|nr:hypothetical protein [Salinibacterium sp. ZJ454]
MTEPQVWVLIGVFAAGIFGMLSWQTISFNRAIGSLRNEIRTEIGSLRNEMSLFRESVDAKIDGLREATDAKFDLVNTKIDSLDRDVQALTRHVFGTDPR